LLFFFSYSECINLSALFQAALSASARSDRSASQMPAHADGLHGIGVKPLVNSKLNAQKSGHDKMRSGAERQAIGQF